MPQIAFLNEHSHPTGPYHPVDAHSCVEAFLDLMIALRKVMPSVSLIANSNIFSLQIGDNYSISQWLNDTRRERRQFMLSLAQRAPFQAVWEILGDCDPGYTEYRFNGEPFDGLIVQGI